MKKYLNVFWFSIFFGTLGIDRFYQGKWKTGILKLVSLGGLGVWYLIDVYRIGLGQVKNADGSELEGYSKNTATIRYSFISYPFFITVIGAVIYRSYEATMANGQPSSSIGSGASWSISLVASYIISALVACIIGYSFFILFTVVDAIRKEKWIWICLNVLGIALGFTVLNIAYYFIARERPKAETAL